MYTFATVAVIVQNIYLDINSSRRRAKTIPAKKEHACPDAAIYDV